MSIKLNKNGKTYEGGFIPKNYPASNIKMANGESVEDTFDGHFSSLAPATPNITISGLYNGYSRSGYLHNLAGVFTTNANISSAVSLITGPTDYMSNKVIALDLIGSDGNIYPFGFSKALGLYCDKPIPSGVTFKFNFSWYYKL